jgi:hypothetical protein
MKNQAERRTDCPQQSSGHSHNYKLSMKIFILLLLVCQSYSFSPPHRHTLPTSLPAYHFGQTQKERPQIQTKRPTSYIPTGLTEEQYAQIKLEDAAKLQGDLGAWGPRWKKVSGDPQGNWFSMPGLWTGGYSREAVGEEIPRWLRGEDVERAGVLRRLLIGCVLGLRRYGVASLMLILSTSYVMVHKQLTVKWIAIRALTPLVALKALDIIVGRVSLRISWLRENGLPKLAAVVGVLVSSLTFIMRR